MAPKYRWALTGTPLTDTPDSLYPILRFLNKDEWPSKTNFIDRYCHTVDNYWAGIEVTGLEESTQEEFFSVFDPRFRRMPKSVVLPQLPPIQIVQRHVEMSDKQARAYRTMAESMVSIDENGELIIAVNPVSKLTRLLQYSSATIEKQDDTIQLVDPSNKLDALMDDLSDWRSANEPVVVFAVHRKLIELAERRLEKAKIPFSVIKGDQSPKVRQAAIDSYMNGDVDVILVVVAAGGVGINLNRGRIGVFLQRSWSLVEDKQARGRIHRIGSEKFDNVFYIEYISVGTVEMRQGAMLEGKAIRLEEVVRDRDTIQRFLNGEE